jgi:hypothetical protein
MYINGCYETGGFENQTVWKPDLLKLDCFESGCFVGVSFCTYAILRLEYCVSEKFKGLSTLVLLMVQMNIKY